MNNTFLSVGLIFIFVICTSLIGNFFDVKKIYYVPFMAWAIALCLFNIILDKGKENIFIRQMQL